MIGDKLKRLFGVIENEAHRNPEFAHRLADALANVPKSSKAKRRDSALVDPLAALESNGAQDLRVLLESLTVDQLKDVIAQYAMDPSRLAMKWKSRDRLVERIMQTAEARLKRGDAFRLK